MNVDIKSIYLENKEKNVWSLRFMWKTSKGTVIHSSSISDFFKSFDVDTVFSGITDVLAFYNKVISLVDNYLKFIVDNGKTVGDHISYTDKELKDARNFFVGVMGEYFFLETVLNKGKIEFKVLDKKGVVGKIFYNATLAPNVDYGIDVSKVDNINDLSVDDIINPTVLVLRDNLVGLFSKITKYKDHYDVSLEDTTSKHADELFNGLVTRMVEPEKKLFSLVIKNNLHTGVTYL